MPPNLLFALIAGVVIFGLFFILSRSMAAAPSVDARVEQFGGRTRAQAAQEGPQEKVRLTAQMDRVLARGRWAQMTARKLAQADLKLTVTEFVLLKVGAMAVGFMFGEFLGRGAGPLQILVGLAGLVVGYFAPDWYVKYRQSRRLGAFNNQLGDTVTLLANSLRSGYSFLQSMEMVARETPPPMGIEFR